jgi:hypothetical protein
LVCPGHTHVSTHTHLSGSITFSYLGRGSAVGEMGGTIQMGCSQGYFFFHILAILWKVGSKNADSGKPQKCRAKTFT